MEEIKETKNETINKKHSKFFSSKLWVTLWAIGMTSYIVISNRTDFVNIAQWLCAVPLAYIGCNVWQKKIYSDKEETK